jgi:ATP-dependent Lhr-like helicase
MAYKLLSEPIRKYIRNKGWEELRPIQVAAITKIMSSDDNIILASKTASGKTEAAFLPILSKVDFNEKGVQILYISPLIALINDQFNRVEELCKDLEIVVTKWHGESNKTQKNNLIKSPTGIVLITPESIEAMFVNKPYNIKSLFSNLKYIVIDEIHSFIGSDRGNQLKSLLYRLQEINNKRIIKIGLSATIGDYSEAKLFTGEEDLTKVLLDNSANQIEAKFKFFKSVKQELPPELILDLYQETKNNKVLIFPNSRGRVEELSVKLKRISEKQNGHHNYFSHHSSVDKEVREYVEYFAKNNNRESFCISCTSTLELGIDIGTVDEVVQIDSAHSIASLIQRVGRSGRKDNMTSQLFLYATNGWSLLQSLSCWLLYKEGFIEPLMPNTKPYDILVHQILSITKSHSGININTLNSSIRNNYAFCNILKEEVDDIITFLFKNDFLELIRNEYIIGIEGEKIVNTREFYSVFKSEQNYKVIFSGNSIGDMPLSLQTIEDENIFLAAKVWKIMNIDHKSKKIDVIPALDGKKPQFNSGDLGFVHEKIRTKMFEIILSNLKFTFLDDAGTNEIEILKSDFTNFNITNKELERPILIKNSTLHLYTFTSTKINTTLGLLLKLNGIKNTIDNDKSLIEIELNENYTEVHFFEQWKKLNINEALLDEYILEQLKTDNSLLNFSKWGIYLPEKYKVNLIKEKHFNLDGANNFISNIKLIRNNNSSTEQ